MTERSDMELVRDYARLKSEAAFAELVRRHLRLVYSAAFRQTGQAAHAEEITQAVFIILARKAAGLRADTRLEGWLHETARLTARSFLRGERRRQFREQEAYMQSTLRPTTDDPLWTQLAPLLDEAVSRLGKKDRDAVLLRFFKEQSVQEVAASLRLGEPAAQQRILRALEKLRKFFARRGVNSTTALLGAALTAHSAQIAPATLAQTVTATVLGQGAVAGGSALAIIQGTLKVMAWAKVKTAMVAGVGGLLVAGAAAIMVQETVRDHEVKTILKRVGETYAALSAYSSSGTTVEENGHQAFTGSFTMRLGREGRYRVEYRFQGQGLSPGQGLTNQGAVWNDGSGDYFVNDRADLAPRPPGDGALNTNAVTKRPYSSPARNLNDVWAVSGGATFGAPAWFFGVAIPETTAGGNLDFPSDAAQLLKAQVVREPDEDLGKTGCYVLSAESDGGTVTLWIGKQDWLIHQSREQINVQITDSDVRALLAKIPVPPASSIVELKRRLNEGRKKAKATGKPVTVMLTADKAATGLNSLTFDTPETLIFTQTVGNMVLNPAFSPADFRR
jgi:RNA polymerase sigma factor (sigma-70 family)